MSIIDIPVVERTLDPAVLSGRDLIDAWRIARDEVFPLRFAEVHRDYAATLDDQFERDAHIRWAEIYEFAFAIALRQTYVSSWPMHGPEPLPVPSCDYCGELDCVATKRVFCDAAHGGEVYVGEDCESRAVEHMEAHALLRTSKVRVDDMDDDDRVRVALRQAEQDAEVAA